MGIVQEKLPNYYLKNTRELRGWTRQFVAEKIGLADPKTLGRWERGISSPNAHFSQKLCGLFGKTAQELGLVQCTNNEQSLARLASPSPIENTPSFAPTDILYDPATPSTLAATPYLIRHEKLLRSIKQHLCNSNHAVCIAIHGLPGVGKTTLSVVLALDYEIQAHFRHGVLWARVGPQPDLLALLSRWGTLLQIPAAQMENLATCEAWIEAIRTIIKTHRILIVIDDIWNIEHALALKVGGPNCAYLMTTRFPNIALQFASRGTIFLPELTTNDGLALLRYFVPELVFSEPLATQELVQLVGGLPLAITLMGKYLQRQVYSGQPRRVKIAIDHLHHAEERLQLAEPQHPLERSPSLPFDTSLSLQAVISTSDLQLDTTVRNALYALSVFTAKPNSFSEEAALAVSAAPIAILDTLVDTGLLESSSPGRYTLHQTIVDYARTKNRDQLVERRLVTYVVCYLQQQGKNYESLDLESTNILVALDLAYEAQMFAELVEISCAFASFLYTRALYTQAEKQLTRAYEIAKKLEDSRNIVITLYHLGELTRKRGNYVKAEIFLKEGLELARQYDYTEEVSSLLSSLAIAVELQGHYAQAEAYYLDGLMLARQLNLHEQTSRLLADLGILTGQQGHYSEAEIYLKEALELERQIGFRERTSAIFTALGWVTTEQAKYEQAEAYLKEGLALARDIGSRERIGALLWALGGAAIDQGYYKQAEAYLSEGLELARSITQLELISELLLKLSIVLTDQGSYKQAETYLNEGRSIAYQLGQNKLIGELLQNLGIVEVKQGNNVQAMEYFREGLAIARQMDLRELLCTSLSYLGEKAISQEHYEEAEEYLQEAVLLARQLGHRRWISQALSNQGMLAVRSGNDKLAEMYLEESLALAHQLNIPHLICIVLYSLGEYYLKQQKEHIAETSFRKMFSYIPEGCKELVANAHYGLARVAAIQNNIYEARQLGQSSLTIFERIGHYRVGEVKSWLYRLLKEL